MLQLGRLLKSMHIILSHRPESKASSLILQSIRKQQAEVEAYTPTTAEDRPGLVVEVLERIPTVDEFKKLHHCKLSQPSIMSFISVTPNFKAHPTNAQALHDVVSESPEALRWPIVVNWETGDIAIGKDKPALRSMMRPIKLLSGQVPPQFKKQGKAVLSEKEVDWSKTA